MKINKIEIKNYKSIQNLTINDFRHLNIFIGKNDAGKSNIIDALDVIFNSDLRSYGQCNKDIVDSLIESVFEEDATRIFYNHDFPEAEFTVYLDVNKKELEKYGFQMDDDAELVISKKLVVQNSLTYIRLNFMRINKQVIIRTPDEKKRFLTTSGSYTSNFEECMAVELLSKLRNEFILIPANRNITRNPAPGSEKLKVEQYIKDSLIELANHKEQDRQLLFEQFTNFISSASPLIKSVEKVMKGKTVVDLDFKNPDNESIPLSTIGGGNNELLLLLHEMIVSGGLILAIEEPEIHLHPHAVRQLYDFMKEFSRTTQMFVVTHSTLFVQPDNIRGLFRVDKAAKGTHIHSMDGDDYINKDRLKQELNTENCEMFFADKVLLVEGISDKIFMEGLIKKYCKSTDEIKVVSSYSKDNFEVYLELLKIFDIPCWVLTDLDALKGRFQIKIIYNLLKHKKFNKRDERIDYLKKHKIHVISTGALESAYPKKYRRGISKPLDALYAIHNLTDEEYYSPRMNDLRDVIEGLENGKGLL